MSELWSCPVCFNTFDEIKFVPKLIPTCGHTFCINCLTGIIGKTCPLDRQPLPSDKKLCQEYPTNILVLQALDESLSSNRCSEHKKSKDRVCLTDCCAVCETCSKGQSHDGHTIKPLEIVKQEAEGKIKSWKLLKEEFQNNKDNLKTLLEEKKKTTKSVQEAFNELRNLLTEKEKRTCNEIDYVFYNEEIIANNQVEYYDRTINELDIHISDLDSNSIINKRFIDTLKKKTLEFPERRPVVVQRLRKVIKNLQDETQNLLQGLSQSIVSGLKNVDKGLSLPKGINGFDQALQDKANKLLDINIQDNQLTLSAAPLTKKFSASQIIPRFEELKIDTVKLDYSKNSLTKESLKIIQLLFNRVRQPSILELDLNGCRQDKLELLKANIFGAPRNIKSFV